MAARRGLMIKTWHATPLSPSQGKENPYAVGLSLDGLAPLITERTRLIAFTACSNILGSIVNVKAVTQFVREAAKAKGARKVEVCVDCVAFAPHRRIDVRDWDVNYVVWSYYKVNDNRELIANVRSRVTQGALGLWPAHFRPLRSHRVARRFTVFACSSLPLR